MPANGKMLRLARQRKQFSQVEAAPKLGIKQSLLSRIENGLVEAREELLIRAEAVYELPQSFFQLADPVYGAPVSVHPMWRRKSEVTVREMDAVVGDLNIRAMHLRRLLEGAEYVHSSDLPSFDIDDFGDPQRIAGLLRAHWKIPSGPLQDLTLHVERAGILVAHSTLGDTSISGVTFSPSGSPPLIVLNGEQPADRLRFTLAHELGHLVMHRFPTPNMEVEANQFASELLMPANEIKPYFIGRRIDLSLLAALKIEWKVSMQALLMRAKALGMLSTNQEQYLWKQINARRLKLREPPELDFEPEQPTVINSLLRLHIDSLGYSRSELASFLHIFESDLPAYFSMPQENGRPRLAILR